MKKYKIIIFDLDGVIIDQSEGITKSVKYALSKFGINEKDHKKLLRFIGPPLYTSFMREYKFNKKKALLAVKFYRETYSVNGLYKFKVYSGIKTMLKSLEKKDMILFVASVKPKIYVDKILRKAKLHTYFKKVYGDTLKFEINKSEIISNILRDNRSIDKSDIVMVGDKDTDILAAKENGTQSIGVTYGFGTLKELKDAKATTIVKNVNELKEKLIY